MLLITKIDAKPFSMTNPPIKIIESSSQSSVSHYHHRASHGVLGFLPRGRRVHRQEGRVQFTQSLLFTRGDERAFTWGVGCGLYYCDMGEDPTTIETIAKLTFHLFLTTLFVARWV